MVLVYVAAALFIGIILVRVAATFLLVILEAKEAVRKERVANVVREHYNMPGLDTETAYTMGEAIMKREV